MAACTLLPSPMEASLLKRIRTWVVIFIVGLVLSGVTAFPLQTEVGGLVQILHAALLLPVATSTHLLAWVERVYAALSATNTNYPFLAYGTDWLAFGHLVIATTFIGAWRDPVRNKWLFDFGLIACAGVIPLAIIAGGIRGIPIPWRFIDCSFGIFGCIPLLLCRRMVVTLEQLQSATGSRGTSG
jgi:hypothetical protein